MELQKRKPTRIAKHILTNKFSRVMPYGLNGHEAKALASKEITEECFTGFYNKNYIHQENLVRMLSEYQFLIISI